MAVALVQKTTQQFYDGVTTASQTLTGVTAGNLVTATVAVASQPNTSPVPALPTPSGWTVAVAPAGSTGTDPYRGICAIYYKANAASGSHTIDFSGGAAWPTDSYGEITIEEWSGCDTTPLDVTASSALATPQTSGTSGTTAATAVADSVAIAVGVPGGGSVSALSTPAATGYTSIDTEPTNASHTAYESSYKILSATGTQSASWNWTGNNSWVGCIAVFKGAAAPSTFDVTESSAGTTAQDETMALTGAAAESSAGTTAQDRSVPLSGPVAESSAGTDTVNRSVALTAPAAESSAGTTTQERSLAATGAVAESSTPSTAQDRTVALGGAVAESSAGTTTQDYTADDTRSVAESSAGTTAQDRSVAAATQSVAESSAGTTNQDRAVTPPAGAGQAGLRRWVISVYQDYFDKRDRQRREAEEAAAEAARRALAPKTPIRRRAAVASAQKSAPAYVSEPAGTAIITDMFAQGALSELHAIEVQRYREQAEQDEEDMLLLSAL